MLHAIGMYWTWSVTRHMMHIMSAVKDKWCMRERGYLVCWELCASSITALNDSTLTYREGGYRNVGWIISKVYHILPVQLPHSKLLGTHVLVTVYTQDVHTFPSASLLTASLQSAWNTSSDMDTPMEVKTCLICRHTVRQKTHPPKGQHTLTEKSRVAFRYIQ